MKRLEFTPTVPHLFPAARHALLEPLFSHRSERFAELYRRAAERLRALSGNRFEAVIAAGTGSWANEVMVWNVLPGARRVLSLVNGEFGGRLYRQCRACRADTLKLEVPWGSAFDPDLVACFLKNNPEIDWVFATATETSCGRCNDFSVLDGLFREKGIRLALDGVSAVGVAPELFELRQLTLLSGSSGKALAALPGLAVIFRTDGCLLPPVAGIPDSLDLNKLFAARVSSGMVRNTIGSPLMACFAASLDTIAGLEYRARLSGHKERIIAGFRALEIDPLPASSSPIVTAFHRPAETVWRRLCTRLEQADIGLYSAPEYLEARNLFEVATMGDVSSDDIDRLLAVLEEFRRA